MDFTTIYTGGTFDLFHAGHVDLLKQCKKIAGDQGVVIVGLNTDGFVEEYKGKPPICPYTERLAMLDSCKYVTRVVAHTHGKDSRPTILNIDPDFIVIGEDWATRDYYAQMGFDANWLRENDIGLIYLAHRRAVSSTIIKGRVQ